VETPRWRATLPNKVVDSNRRLDVNTVIRDYVTSRVSLRAVRADQGMRAKVSVASTVRGTDAVPAEWILTPGTASGKIPHGCCKGALEDASELREVCVANQK